MRKAKRIEKINREEVITKRLKRKKDYYHNGN